MVIAFNLSRLLEARKHNKTDMKKIMSLLIALTFCGAVVGQRADRRPKNPNDVATMQSERLKKSLDLSDEQFASVESTNLKFAERISQLRSDTTMTRETRHQKMTELRNKKQSKIENN